MENITPITASVCISDIDMNRVRKGNNGKEYCDIVIFPTPNSKYSDLGIKQSISKEERDSGVQLPFVGEAKTKDYRQREWEAKNNMAQAANGQPQQQQQQQPQPQQRGGWGATAQQQPSPQYAANQQPRGVDDDVPF